MQGEGWRELAGAMRRDQTLQLSRRAAHYLVVKSIYVRARNNVVYLFAGTKMYVDCTLPAEL